MVCSFLTIDKIYKYIICLFYDYKNIGIICELSPVRTFMIKRFYKAIPDSRIRVSLSIIDEIILKINDNDIDKFLENIHDLGENVLYMLSFQNFIRDEEQSERSTLNENDDQQKSYFVNL